MTLLKYRLYLSARFVFALIGLMVAGSIGVLRAHDHLMQEADRACFQREWGKGITQEQEKNPPGTFTIALDDEQTGEIAGKCNVWVPVIAEIGPPTVFSRRTWRNPAQERDDLPLALAAFTPLVVLVGLRRWIMWLTRPLVDSRAPPSRHRMDDNDSTSVSLLGDRVMTIAVAAQEPAASPPSLRPSSITKAATLLYVTLGIGVLRAAMEFPRLSAMAGAAFVIFIQLIVFGLTWLLIFLISRRRNWARIVYVALFLLGTPLSVKPLVASLAATPVSGVLGLGQAAAQVIAIVMLFRGEARAWFKKPRADPPSPPSSGAPMAV